MKRRYKVTRFWKDCPPTIVTLDEVDMPWSLHVEEFTHPNLLEIKIKVIMTKDKQEEE